MNMNIKKIIREELDWEWTQFEPIEPREEGDIRVGDVYTIYDREYNIRYVFEIIEITDDRIFYEILVTDDVYEPVGSIISTELKHGKTLVLNDFWILTDYHGKGFIKESEEDGLDWIRKSEPIDLDKEVKDYVDNDFVVAIWFGYMDDDLKEYINKFIIKENFKWVYDRLQHSWVYGNDIKGLTFYPPNPDEQGKKIIGGFSGFISGNPRLEWEHYHQEVMNGEYNDIDPNMFHSIEYEY